MWQAGQRLVTNTSHRCYITRMDLAGADPDRPSPCFPSTMFSVAGVI